MVSAELGLESMWNHWGMRVKKLAIYVATAAVALAFAASALAGSADDPYYGQAAGAQAAVTKTNQAATKGATKGGTLPFTGLDLTFIVAGGVVLLLVGAGLRRAGRNKA